MIECLKRMLNVECFLLSVARCQNRNVARCLMTVQVFIPSRARSRSALVKTIDLATGRERQLTTGKRGKD